MAVPLPQVVVSHGVPGVCGIQNLEVCGESRLERVRKLLSSPLARRKSGTLALRTFGVPLHTLVQQGAVPFVVVRLCQYIENRGMAQEGLFRVSGNARLVDKLKWSFDHTGDAPLEMEGDVAAAAALLKLLFRELPEPLVPPDMHPAFLDAIQATVHDKEECTRRLKCLVERLPHVNFGVLKYLCHFLHRVAQSEEHTRMNPGALGIVFGPNLFRFTEDLQGLKEQAVTNQVVTCFIADYTSIFEGDAELSCTADTAMSIQSSSGDDDKCNGRVMTGMSAVPMQPLSVVIPPLDEPMMSLKRETLSGIPTLMIDSLVDDTCNQTIIYRHNMTKEGNSSGVTSGRNCKRKERKLSGEEWPQAPRSSSEERPAVSSLVEPELASRRCSSHEEVATLDSAQGGAPQSAGSPRVAVASDDANRDLSPHPPQPKRREIETPSSSSQESSQDWHEACRNVERLTPHHFKDVQYKPSQRKSGVGKERQGSTGSQAPVDEAGPAPMEKEMDEQEESSQPHTPSTLNKDSIPPLDLESFREEEPVLSEHRFSWPMVQALTEEEVVTPYLQKANSYEAPLSPSAYRSYLSHRSLHLDPNLPPSPPVEQDDFPKRCVTHPMVPTETKEPLASLFFTESNTWRCLHSNFKEEEATMTTVKQLSKKIHGLKKKVKHFEENFEKEHGYRIR